MNRVIDWDLLRNEQSSRRWEILSLAPIVFFGILSFVSLDAQDAPSPEPDSPVVIKLTDRVPFGRPPVDYFSLQTSDAVSRLQKRLDSGDLQLMATQRGYLDAVLQGLKIETSSQLLVFSKTARSPNLVSPQTPRAIYFNDDVTVAWIPESRELELTAIDPLKGANFYTLSQPTPDDTESADPARSKQETRLQFIRRDRCLACHAGQSSLDVPGMLLRAFQTDATGKPLFGFSRVTHDTTYDRRWGGWYVTGSPRDLTHRGNLIGKADNERHKREPGFRAQINRLSDVTDLSALNYSADSSDVIAHLVFAHQMHGLNLLIRVGMEARLGRRSDAEDRLIRYLVFADEPPLPARIDRSQSDFLTWFEKQSPADERGRSLRKCDLQTRLLKFRLSWLVNHTSFTALPARTRDSLLTRLYTGLTTAPASRDFAHLPDDERRAIVEIVRATVGDLPDCWLP